MSLGAYNVLAKGGPLASPFESSLSFSCDGTDDVLTLAASDQLITGTNVTVSMWFNIGDTSGGAERIFFNSRDGNATNLRFIVNADGTFTAGYKDSSSILSTSSTSAVDDGAWHHVAFTTTASAQVLYIDGEAVATTSNTFNNGASSTIATTIGAQPANNLYAEVKVDELAFFSSVLTASEVDALYNNGHPGSLLHHSTLLAHYRMGEGTLTGGKRDGDDNLLFDQSTNGGLGSELVKTDPFVTGSWSGYSANVVTFPNTTTVRVERPTSGGSHQGAAADLTTSILQSTPTAGTTLKISFDLNTDDSDIFGQIYNGSAFTNTTAGSGRKTVFLTMTGTGFIRFGGLDADKFVELTNFTVKEVQNAGTISGATAVTSVPLQLKNLKPISRGDKALSFDGGDDVVDLGASSTFFSGNVNSISMWFKMPDTSGGAERIFVSNSDAGASDLRIVVETSGKITVDFWNGSSLSSTAGGPVVDDSAWHHLAFTTTASAQALYVDGKSVATTTHTRASRAGSVSATIGAHVASSVYADVDVSDVAIFNAALSAPAVKALYNAGQPTHLTVNMGAYTYKDNLLAYYKMGSGTVPSADNSNGFLFDQTNPGVGPELMKADDDLYIDERWYVFSDPEKTYPGGTAARFTNPTSGGWNQGGRIFLTSGGTIHALTENMETGSVYKLSFDFLTDDSDAVPSYHNGTSATSLPAGSGSKTFYFTFSGNAATRLEAANVSAGKFVEFSKLSLAKVNGHTATITSATIITGDVPTPT